METLPALSMDMHSLPASHQQGGMRHIFPLPLLRVECESTSGLVDRRGLRLPQCR